MNLFIIVIMEVINLLFDNIRMDYIDESNLLPGMRWSDRVTYDGMWENNLYNFVRQITPRLVNGIKRPFRLEGMTRIDDTPVHKGIREALNNMIIHADYLITGILKVVKTDDGYSFSNPGSLKLPVQAIYEGGHSVARNPRIQQMFRMIGLGDNIGSGFPTILSAWGDEQWRKPDLYQDDELHQVELRLWMTSLMPIECTEFLKKLFGLKYDHLDRESQIILGTAYLEESVSNVRMQSILNMHSTDIGHLLSSLVEQKFLVADRKGRWTRYRLNLNYTIVSEQYSLEDMVVIDKGNQIKNESDRIIYKYIEANGFITTKQVLEITKITTSQGANMALGRLMKLDLIEKKRKGRQFYYEIKDN